MLMMSELADVSAPWVTLCKGLIPSTVCFGADSLKGEKQTDRIRFAWLRE